MAFLDFFRPSPKPAPVDPEPAPPPDAWDDVPAQAGHPPKPSDLPIVVTGDWANVDQAKRAIRDLDRGMFAAAAGMLDAMLTDGHIMAKLDDRIGSLFGAPFDFGPPPGKDDAGELAKQLEQVWAYATADNAHKLVLRDGIMLGAGLASIEPVQGDGEWKLGLKHWHARHLWWNWGTRRYNIQTLRGSEQLNPDGRGGYYSEWTEGGVRHVTRWVLFTPYGYQRGWINGKIRALVVPWMLRQYAMRDWGRYNEILGIPPQKIKVPAEWSQEEKQRALREMAVRVSEMSFLCPQMENGVGFDVELMTAAGEGGWEAFERLLGRAELAITVALVGQSLTTQVDASGGGSRALGEVHERVEQKITKADASSFSDCIRNAFVMPWMDLHGKGSPDLAPVPRWAVEPPDDTAKLGAGLKAVGDGIAALKLAGVPVDREAVCADAGIPVEEGAAFEDPEPPAPPPGAPGAPPGRGRPPPGKTGKPELHRDHVELSRRRQALEDGQGYVDRVSQIAQARAADIISGDVRRIRKLLNTAASVDELKAGLLSLYREMKPGELAEMVRRVQVMAGLAGRLSVLKEG